MGFWAKSLVIFNSLCGNATQSLRQLAHLSGFSKSSVGDPRKAGRFSVGHVLCGTEFSHEFNHPTEDRPAWDFGREVA